MNRAHGMHVDKKMKNCQYFSKQLQIKSDHVLSQALLEMNKVGSDRNNDFSIPNLIRKKSVSMIRKYHTHTMQTNPRHREEEPHNTICHKPPARQLATTSSFVPIKVLAKLDR